MAGAGAGMVRLDAGTGPGQSGGPPGTSLRAWVIPGGSNIGVIEVSPGRVCLVDAGSDADAAKKALRLLAQEGLAVEALIVTHAHADHTGGARAVRDRTGCRVLASRFEAAVMRAPVLEPVYLYGGAVPPRELTSGDLVAPPCEVDEVVAPGTVLTLGDVGLSLVDLAGHTPGQIGVATQPEPGGTGPGVLFCADAIFPSYVFKKYRVAVAYDLDASEQTLQRLTEAVRVKPQNQRAEGPPPPTGPSAAILVPGHGGVLSPDAAETEIQANRAAISDLVAAVESALGDSSTGDEAEVVALALDRLGVSFKGPSYYYLCRTSVLAALVRLQKRAGWTPVAQGTRVVWRRVNP